MKWIKKHTIIFLAILGLLLLAVAIALFAIEEPPRWISELAKAFMTLSATIIFGGIIKLIFEVYQDEKSARKKEEDFKNELLIQLRNVFDRVDNTRILLKAHKSAKTYGEGMRFEIIPCITTLYDIKRSLVDTYSMSDMPQNKIQELRLNIHYMIAYLQVLVEEYEAEYPAISHQQFLHEELKKRERNEFVSDLMGQYPLDYFTDEFLTSLIGENRIQQPPFWVWNTISTLEHIGYFIRDPYDGPYRKMFMDFYEPSKRILKGKSVPKKSTWYREKHLQEMLRIDAVIVQGELKQSDSLIALLIDHLKKESAKVVT